MGLDKGIYEEYDVSLVDFNTDKQTTALVRMLPEGLELLENGEEPLLLPYPAITVIKRDSGEGGDKQQFLVWGDDQRGMVFTKNKFTKRLATVNYLVKQELVRPISNGRWFLVISVFSLAIFSFLFWLLPRLAAPISQWIPSDWERQAGDLLSEQWVAGSGYCAADGVAQGYIQAVVEELIKPYNLTYPIKVHVIHDEQENAFATLGGHVFILSGLLKESESASELIGVLAHELGHVIEKHPLEGVVRQLAGGVALSLMLGDTAGFEVLMLEAADFLSQMSYSREAESMADQFAIDMLNRLDISPDGIAGFFQRLASYPTEKDEEAVGLEEYFSTHPLSHDRVSFFMENGVGTGNYWSKTEWLEVKRMCE